jgi:hypothetical protein
MTSKQVLKFNGKVQQHKFLPDEPQAFMDHVKSLEGEAVVATLKKYRPYKERSNQQNRYYWGVLVKILSNELGYTPEEVHEVIKYKFLLTERTFTTKEGDVRQLFVAGSTASLSTSDFEALMSRIRSWASAELSIYIPEPNEVPFEY